MFDIVYRFSPGMNEGRQPPADAAEAVRRLEDGSREFASLADPAHAPAGSRVFDIDPEDVGLAPGGGPPKQQPFAVVVGCSDARVPTELVFNRACNELFVVRVAGHALGREGLGSIDYAVDNLGAGLKLLVVLGHAQCGAVGAAVDSFLHPANYLAVASNHHLRSIVGYLFPVVRSASVGLERNHGPDVVKRPGYQAALVEAAVVINAALTASVLHQEFAATPGSPLRAVYGVYDLESRHVRVPDADPETDRSVRLLEPPHDGAGFRLLNDRVANSPLIRRLLGGGA